MAKEPWVVIGRALGAGGAAPARAPAPLPLPGAQAPARSASACAGILFVLHTGIPWQDLPPELGFGSGVTCWRRLEEWQQAGVWDRAAPAAAAASCAPPIAIDFSRAIVDSSQVQAKKGAPRRARARSTAAARAPSTTSSPTRAGVPLAVSLTGGNRNDITQLIPLVDAVPAIAGTVGPPAPAARACSWPTAATTTTPTAASCAGAASGPLIARRRTAHGSGPRARALAGGAQPRLAAPVPPPPGALRAAGRHPRGLPDARLLPDLPQEAPGVILKPALRVSLPGSRRARLIGRLGRDLARQLGSARVQPLAQLRSAHRGRSGGSAQEIVRLKAGEQGAHSMRPTDLADRECDPPPPPW